MCKNYFPSFGKVIVAFAFFMMSSEWEMANAMVNGVHGIHYSSSAPVECYANPSKIDSGSYFKGNACNIFISGYVPVSGKYKVRLTLDTNNHDHADSTFGYFDSTKDLASQTVTLSSSNVSIPFTSEYALHACYLLVDEAGREWSLPVGDGRGCSGYTPIPPIPPAPTVSCTINNSGALSVDFGSLERTSLPTVPGTGQIQSKQIPVVCTSSSSSSTINMSMKVNYTSITVSGTQVIKTSSNGVGVSVLYNNQVLASGSAKNIVFNTGSNSLTLGFEAVRNPTVSVGDVPTGSFSASAVMVMTMQ
ncbi:fimbrial protein [Cronobacter dublinensis]|uniref:fimbrial protein n=1 Tax=Cronobacter dublinensis TaxID=413497 RepID=UPI0024AFAF1E|nr:fimbrial protein [Cronobacter dublinensis]MDI7383819.1 fimbrial protein [Cronobacter dublinensis]